jgi:hypothetical protein
MTASSPGAWRTAAGAAGDVFRAFSEFKTAYLGLFVCSVVQQFLVGPQSEKPAGAPFTSTDAFLLSAVLAIGFFAVPFAIQLWRYFAAGDMSWGYSFRRPFWRLMGWAVVLVVLVGLYMFAAIFVFVALSMTSEIAGIVAGIALFIFLCWLALRLATFYPALTLDEPSPLLRRSFRETKGWSWFIFRTGLAVIVILIPVFALLAGWQIWLYGLEAFANPEAGLPPLEANMRFADSLVVGVLMAFFMIYQAAISGRIYRIVRSR